MRYKKNFYYTNIEYSNNKESEAGSSFNKENKIFIDDFHTFLEKHYSWPSSIVEFGADFGARLNGLKVDEKLAVEFDHVAELYYQKHSKTPAIFFQTLEDFIERQTKTTVLFDCGFFLDFFLYCDTDNYYSLISKMLEYCDFLFLVSKDLTSHEMAKKVENKNLSLTEVEMDSVYSYLIIEKKGGSGNGK